MSAFHDWIVIIAAYSFLFSIKSPVVYTVWFVVTVLVVGIWRHRLAILGHESAHGLISRDAFYNTHLANIIVFWPNLLQARTYEDFHLRHHHSIGTDNDPELFHKKLNPKLWVLPLSRRKLIGRIAFGLVGGLAKETLLIFKMIGPKTIMDLVGPLLWWAYAIFIITTLFDFEKALVFAGVWTLSTVTSFITTFHVRMLSEHHGSGETQRIEAGFLARLIYLPHNGDHHYEHHEYPYIPYYYLRVARRRIEGTTVPAMNVLSNLSKELP